MRKLKPFAVKLWCIDCERGDFPINLWSKPVPKKKGAKSVIKAKHGDVCIAIKRRNNREGTWYLVEHELGKGWVHDDLLGDIEV